MWYLYVLCMCVNDLFWNVYLKCICWIHIWYWVVLWNGLLKLFYVMYMHCGGHGGRTCFMCFINIVYKCCGLGGWIVNVAAMLPIWKWNVFKCMYIGDEAFKAGLLIHGQWADCMAFGPVIYCIYREVAYGRTYERPHGLVGCSVAV